MRYTSWDRTDRDRPVLLEEDGLRELATFTDDHAEVAGERWEVSVDKKQGASLTLPDGREFLLYGDLTRDSQLRASLDGRTFALIGETSKEWIIDDADDEKVGQFTLAKHGVRKAIVEYDGDVSVSDEEAVALGFFARMILEQRTERTGVMLIATLVLLTIVAIAVFLI